MRRQLALLLFMLATWALVAATAGGASRDLGAFGDGRLITDGRGYVATVAGDGMVRVLDLRSSERRTVDVSRGCYGQGLSAGKLVVSCALSPDPDVYATGYTIDLRTGARVDLPPLTRTAFGTSAQSGYSETYKAVGRRWAEIDQADYHSAAYRYLDLTTGAVIDEPGRELVADLDAPSGVRRLCAPVRRPPVPNPVFLGLTLGRLSEAGRYAAAVYYREDARGNQTCESSSGSAGAPRGCCAGATRWPASRSCSIDGRSPGSKPRAGRGLARSSSVHFAPGRHVASSARGRCRCSSWQARSTC